MNIPRNTADPHRVRLHPRALAVCALLGLPTAHAVELTIDNPDWSARFDNTVKAGTIYRLKNADPVLVDTFRQIPTGAPPPAPASFSFPSAENFNAGDDNFRRRGFVSERLDLLSEFDLVYKKTFGMRLSAAAWYDHAYRGKTDATDPVNGQTPIDEFAEHTKRIAGRKAEVLDAFVFGGFDLGDNRRLNVKLGQHALQYGESLFFGDNAVAKAQGPVDINKLLSSPNAQFKEIIRPIPQISANLQLSPTISVGAYYYQFRWEADRLAPAGSYFSTANIPWGSAQPEFIGIPAPAPFAGNYRLSPGGDLEPRNSGQFGGQLKWRLDEADIGVYAAKFHDKDGQLFSNLNSRTPAASNWYYQFPEDIKVYGASVSQSLGDFNLSAEASVRSNMPLRSQNIVYATGFGPTPQIARGRTAHVNLSTLASFGPNVIARESVLVAEIAWNRVLSKDDPDNQLDAGRTRDATAIQFIYTPTYRQVLPGLDIFVPIGARYTVDGNSSVTAWDAKGAGNVTLGLNGTYLGNWQFTLNYTKYVGKAAPFVDYSGLLPGGSGHAIYGLGNNLADRDNLALSIRRTF